MPNPVEREGQERLQTRRCPECDVLTDSRGHCGRNTYPIEVATEAAQWKQRALDLGEAAEAVLEELEPTHLDPNPAYHEARRKLREVLDQLPVEQD